MPPRQHDQDDPDDEWGREREADGGEPGPEDFELADEERFSGNTAFCPDCGKEVYDDADVCPACFTWLNGETARHPPEVRRRRQQGRGLVVLLLVASMLMGFVAWILGLVK